TSDVQLRKAMRTEVLIRKRNRQSFGVGDRPRPLRTTGRGGRQRTAHAQSKQHGATTTASLPLMPQHGPKPPTYPPGQLDQHIRGFAEPEIAPPAPQIRRQSRHRLLQALASTLPCEFANSVR